MYIYVYAHAHLYLLAYVPGTLTKTKSVRKSLRIGLVFSFTHEDGQKKKKTDLSEPISLKFEEIPLFPETPNDSAFLYSAHQEFFI